MASCSVLDMCDFKFTPAELVAKAEATVSECRKDYDAIASVPDNEVGFETVLSALNSVERKLDNGYFAASFPQYVAVDAELRNASVKVDKMYQDFIVEKNMRQDIFRKIQLLEAKNLDLAPEPKYYLQKLLEVGKENGLHLPDDVQKEIKALKEQMNEKSLKFSKNISDSNTILEFSDEELLGLPEDFINDLSKSPDTGKRKVTLKYPHYIPIMQKCKNPETRKAMNFAFDSQCMEENPKLLEELITLRHKHANLLEFPNHAAFAAHLCQAKTKERVHKFLTDLNEKLQPLWSKEKEYLLQLKEQECREMKVPFDGKLNVWDMAYYTTKVKELKYNVDHNKLKEYFLLSVVRKGLLHIYQKLLGLVFTEVESPKVWHPDVKMFSVKNASDGQLLGYFFLDLFPREGKYEHAAIKIVQNAFKDEIGARQIAVGAMVTNFSPPSSNKPSLLQHHEVETFFHEFGHVMHLMCAQNEYAHFNIFKIQSDFLEVPSEILENWCWESAPLKLMSGHYLSGETLPDDLLSSLIKSRFANSAYSHIRQICLSLFDHLIHSQEKVDTAAVYKQVMKELLGVVPQDGTNFAGHFRHLCDFYDARYYGYLWCKVSSTDMFETRFKGNDLLSEETGMMYRKKVLEPAASKDPTEIVRDFLGRDPTQDALLRIIGVM